MFDRDEAYDKGGWFQNAQEPWIKNNNIGTGSIVLVEERKFRKCYKIGPIGWVDKV
jgi:hypothetical protein